MENENNYVSVLTGTEIDTALQLALKMVYDDVKVYPVSTGDWILENSSYGKYKYTIAGVSSGNMVVKFKGNNNLIYDMTVIDNTVYSNSNLAGKIIVNTFIPVDQSSN